MNNYIIYMHKNKINGKVYIGQTKQQPEKRWKNGEGYIDSPRFYNAIKKYGWENFSHKILIDNLTLEEADIQESYYIKLYKATDERYGYNINEGGGSHARGKQLSILISKGQKKNWQNNLQRKIKQSNKLKEQWKKQEYREKFIGQNNGNSTQLKCIETNMIFKTVKEAAQWAKTSRQNISGCLAGRQNTAGGYHWQKIGKKGE